MLRHVVLLTLKDEMPDGQIDTIRRELMRLPDILPIQRYEMGVDAGISEGNASIAILGEFASEDDYQTYAADPTHVGIIKEHILPWVSARTAVQHHIDAP